jgi:enamine deaminase RidA (YjgF/YER057c/UK114 family)
VGNTFHYKWSGSETGAGHRTIHKKHTAIAAGKRRRGKEYLMTAEERLRRLGLELPDAVPPQGKYVPFVRTGNLVFTAGSGCYRDGEWVYQGRVPDEVTVEEARDAARITGLNLLSTLRAAVGSLDKIARVVKVTGFVASAPGFCGQPEVVNGASELFMEVFGEKGNHARSAVGVSELPLNLPVEIEMIVEVKA